MGVVAKGLQVAADPLTVDLLGPLRVSRGSSAVEVRGGRLRTLLVHLALAADRAVPVTALVDAVWGAEPPADAANALQSLVSRLRTALGDPALVRQVHGGYLLAVDPEAVDALRFERLSRDPATAAEALALWRGPIAEPSVRLEELRRATLLHRLDQDVAARRDVVAELQDLVRAAPLDEDLAGLLMLALSRQGRQGDALQEYQRVRTALADELGADPSSALADRHLEVLRTRPDAPRHNLRAALTSFVGRDAELVQVAAQLAAHRLVTVVGPGGAGKTRLATEAAAHVGTPAWLVELAPVTDPDDVPHAVGTAAGLRETALLDTRAAPRELVDRLVEALSGREVLLVLDNAEHLLDAVAHLADALLARCPELRVLVTSREALGIAGESLVPLPPLDVPAVGSTPAAALAHPAVALFADRAAAVRPGFSVDVGTVADVVELVRRLDGLPLALELAAARLRSLPLSDVVRRLDDRFRLLTGGSRTALPRHRTLQAVVAWSWDLLTEDERHLAARASVFPAGLTGESAGAVVDPAAAPDLLAALADKSLLQLVGGSRYRMLETLREYGTERLAESGELAAVRRAHAGWFAALAARAEPELRGADQLAWLAVLQAERDNVLAALRCLTDLGETDAALRLGLDLGWYWLLLGRNAEAAGHLRPVLALPRGTDEPARLSAEIVCLLHEQAAAGFTRTPDDLAVPRATAERLRTTDVTGRPLLALLAPVLLWLVRDGVGADAGLAAAMETGDPWLAAAARLFRARFNENAGDMAAVRDDVGPALSGFRAVGDRWGTASTLPLAAELLQYDGDLRGAVALLEEAAGLSAELGSQDRDDQVFISLRLADLHLRLGDHDRAAGVLDTASALVGDEWDSGSTAFLEAMQSGFRRRLGDLDAARRLQSLADARLDDPDATPAGIPHGMAAVHLNGAWLDLSTGDLAGARRRLAIAHEAALASRDLPITSLVAVGVAGLALALDRPSDAAALLGAAARLRGADDPTALDVTEVRAAARSVLGGPAYDAAYAGGRGLDAAAALALVDPARFA